MFNTIIIVATSMGIVAFSGIGYNFMFNTVNGVGGYASWFDVYIIFVSGVGLGVCILGLYDQIVYEYFEGKE